jgi:4-amino-4-deoxy-L-arabinose transferase-like glycosyltransferase
LSVPFGEHLNERLTFYPPFYPMVLSLPKILGFDLMAGARWIQMALFGANIVLVGLILGALLHESFWLPLWGAFFMATSLAMLNIHAMAWSEPLYIFLTLLGLFCLSRYLELGKTQNFVAAIVASALALLTRYVGFALVAAGGLALLLWSSHPPHRRLKVAVVFAIFSLLPLSIWMVGNLASSGMATGRQILFHPPDKARLLQLLFTLSDWLRLPPQLPNRAKAVILMGGAIIGAVIFFRLVKRSGPQQVEPERARPAIFPSFVKISLLYGIVYLFMLALSSAFLDANTPLDSRILSPVYILAVIVGLLLVGTQNKIEHRRTPIHYGLNAAIVLLGALYLIGSVNWIQENQGVGFGYTSLRWRTSQALQELNQYPAETIIFSNAPEPIYLHTSRPARFLPRRWCTITRQENPYYLQELSQLKQILHEKPAVIVYFLNFKRTSLEEEEMLIETMQLCLSASLPDARIYQASGDGKDCLSH